MFDFVFGDQNFISNISSRESVAVVSRLPRKEVCGGGIGDVVGKLGLASDISEPESMEVVDRLPCKEACEVGSGDVVVKSQNDLSIFATPLPEFVLEQRQRCISRESGGSTGSSRSTESQPPTCTIIEEGREWYGYRDEGIRQAAEMFGVTGPWIRPNSASAVADTDADKSKGTGEEGKGDRKKGKPFWHGNGRKVGVEERWMCVGDDEFGISDELVVVNGDAEGGSEGSEGSVSGLDGEDNAQGRGEDDEGRPWWSVRWKNVFMMLACGVLA